VFRCYRVYFRRYDVDELNDPLNSDGDITIVEITVISCFNVCNFEESFKSLNSLNPLINIFLSK